MFGRTRPAVGLVWGPGLSEVLGGSNAGVTTTCPWCRGGSKGVVPPAVELAVSPESSTTPGSQDWTPSHFRVGLWRRVENGVAWMSTRRGTRP